MTETFIPQPFGPLYPKLGASVAKFRKIKNPTAEQRQAHGAAVEQAILALQRSALQRAATPVHCPCASGTWHNNADGKVGKAIRDQQHAALLACPDKIRAARTDQQLIDLYDKAMREKLGRDYWTAEAAE